MTNHFIYSYAGNKRDEFKYLNNVIDDIDNYNTIFELFCGTSAISFNIWLKHPNRKFILNDNDNDLIKVYNLIKNEDIETIKNRLLDIKKVINGNKEVYVKLYHLLKRNKFKYPSLFESQRLCPFLTIFPQHCI